VVIERCKDLSIIDIPSRRFTAEFSAMVDKLVAVRTKSGKEYSGRLVGYESSNYSIVLADAKDMAGNEYHRIIIYGSTISEIFLIEEPLDLGELARRLEERFPRMVKYYPDSRVILVMDKIRVTEKGVEGSGPMAERVKDIFNDFIEKAKAKK